MTKVKIGQKSHWFVLYLNQPLSTSLSIVCSPVNVTFLVNLSFEQSLSYLNTFLLSVVVVTPVKKKRGRPPKQQAEEGKTQEEDDEVEAAKKAKRALNRFNGMSVAEVMAKTLPDVITYNLDILIVSY